MMPPRFSFRCHAMYKLLVPAVLAAFLAGCSDAPRSSLDGDAQRIGYAVGYQLGTSLGSDAASLDAEAVAAGMEDALAGRSPRLDEAARDAALARYGEQRRATRAARAEANRQAGAAYLEKRRAQAGVKALPSGVQYRVVEAGRGRPPKRGDTVVAHYRGTLLDGTEFDSSYARGRPETFKVASVIPGWQEVLLRMRPGARWEVAIPPAAAYGARGIPGVIGPQQTLLFEIHLLEVRPAGGS